jgi:capsular polysaccharide transport system ATP-binding protein
LIVFDDVTKYQRGRGASQLVLSGVSATFHRGQNPAILCDKDREISALARLLVGADHPDRGKVTRHGRVSWPLGDMPGAKGQMSVLESLSFIARIYGVHVPTLIEYVDEFVQLGSKALSQAISQLDKNRRLLLPYAVVLSIPFDWYVLVDDLKLKDDRAAKLVEGALEQRLGHANAIIITDDVRCALRYGTVGAVCKKGKVSMFDTVEEAADTFLKGFGR